MTDVHRLQAYLRDSAAGRYETISVPPFTLFFHPNDDLPYFNYAIPDEPVGGDLRAPLAGLRAAFEGRSRVSRFEFLHEFAPALGEALRAAGFVEEARQPFMVCTPGSYHRVPSVTGLSFTTVTAGASVEDGQDFWYTQRRGFDPDGAEPLTPEEARRLLGELCGETGFLARLDGRPVAAAMLMSPAHGVAELAGIATLPPFRRRGIGTALTAHAVRGAFDEGIEIICLTAGDEWAGRVYERVGFVPAATMTAYRGG